VLNEEKLDEINIRLEHSPSKYLTHPTKKTEVYVSGFKFALFLKRNFST
jgi:hypothetical protein